MAKQIRKIWKHELDITDTQEVMMPRGSFLRAVQWQNGVPCLWTEGDTALPSEPRLICMYGTGHPMPDDPGMYVATIQTGGLVFHVYDGGWKK